MSDPFTFDPSRVHRENLTGEHWDIKRVSYALPTGEVLQNDTVVGAGGAGGAGGMFLDQDSANVPADAIPLWRRFQERVAGLSAHGRLAWIDASRREEEVENLSHP